MKKTEPDIVHIGACLLKSRAFSVPVRVELNEGGSICGIVDMVDRRRAVFVINGKQLKLREITGVEEEKSDGSADESELPLL
ncbi:hypothetical protein [Alkalicoccus luteus]|uniref:Uncharacterized protein n=1 Tax=Alkalicoccus luteus TaxID=1237094 RepID=A0A969PWF5_9BACI|nr:hypothetical protein [Alkalicoccus luteus]NJP36887.1 hypothetical protein [Alkalicoccus luteus]